AVNNACYVQNRVLVVKPHKKIPYELFHGKSDDKVDEGFFVRYSLNSKAFRVFNNRTRIVEGDLHIRFSENTPNIAGSGPNWLFDIDALTNSMNYKPVMDVKSDFLYGKIKEEVYVYQPPGFEDPDFPDKVYKVEKALYGLHQAPSSWYETFSMYLLGNGFHRGKIDKTLFIRRHKDDILLV
nr:reverse transcriptase [Tanacetum cinerariifolium]